MSTKRTNQSKLLYVMKYFQEYTDDSHPASVMDIIIYLDSLGISAERKSVYRDIEKLKGFGLDIITEKTSHCLTHYLAERKFEPAELRLLIDLVQSSYSLSEGKTRRLVSKLKSLASAYEFDSGRNEPFADYTPKTSNESVLYNADCIRQALLFRHSITFDYSTCTDTINCRCVSESSSTSASPYSLFWRDGRYCMLAYSHRENRMRIYYLDRMSKCADTGYARLWVSAFGTDKPADYIGIHFGTDVGIIKRISFEFDRDLLDLVADTFSDKATIYHCSEAFCAYVNMIPGPCFMAWINSLGGKARLTCPESAFTDAGKPFPTAIESIKKEPAIAG